jgi:DNA-binding beta-propeller fold protein YncE
LSYPFDVACDAEDRIYVADYNNHRVDIFDAEGAFLESLGGAGQTEGQFRFPWSLTVDPRGRLLVSDTGNSRVQIYALPPKPVAQGRRPER